jgi:hypothetical protein
MPISIDCARKRPQPLEGHRPPRWLHENRDRVQHELLTVSGVELPLVYRCLVTISTDDDSAAARTLDVAFKDFDASPKLSQRVLVQPAYQFLSTLPMLPLIRTRTRPGTRLKLAET